MMMFFGQLNGIYYINKIMSKYRYNALGSWTKKSKLLSEKKQIERRLDFIKAMEEFDKYTSYKYHKLCILRMLHFSIEIVKLTTNRKDLLFKNRKEFFGRFNFFQKSVLLMYILFPNLATQLRKIYKIFKY